ncbi:hypothetical protein KM1_245250 [Entamoeba histolytica HM-3:IMSS]|nr:hypothetical protein KM1_245250 [Entamoeba histolytica HM-3:IMSS]GAT93701.1 hypothetical protein CL6EHI_177440 [Entamoeba histolytica]
MEPDLIESKTVLKAIIYTEEPIKVKMVNRENHIYVCSKAGGPILYYPDPNKISSGGKSKPSISIADGKGNKINDIEIVELESGDNIYKAGWLDDYRIVVITRNRYIHIYTTDGNLVVLDDTYSKTKFRQGNPKLLNAYIYGLGVVLLLGVEVVNPEKQERIKRSIVITGIFNLKTDRIEFTRKMFPETSEILLHYNRFANTLIGIFLNENGIAYMAENLFFYFKFPNLISLPLNFSAETKKNLEILSYGFSYDGSQLLALQKDIKTQNFEINIYKFETVKGITEIKDPNNKEKMINAPQNTYTLQLLYEYNFDQTAHLGSSNRLFWLDNDLFGVEIYPNVFQIHSINTETDEYLIDTIDHVYCIIQEVDGIRFHCLEEIENEKKYVNAMYCPYDPDLRKLNQDSPASYLWQSFIKPEDASFVNKFSEHVYESIEIVCKAALSLPPSDERQIQLMRCASYGLMLASPEDAKKGSPFMQTIVKLLRLLHTMNNNGCMMTYKEFYSLAAIERCRIKDSLHNHTKRCSEFYRHPVQCILVSLNLFSLCNVWSTECDMSIESLEEQWCYRKARRIACGIDSDIPRFKQHMNQLSQPSLLRVINVCLKKPQIEIICEIASISNICRDMIIRNLPTSLTPKQRHMYLTYLAKICIAYSDSYSFCSLLNKVMTNDDVIDFNGLPQLRSILETPCSSIIQTVDGNLNILKFCAQFDTVIQQSSFALFQRWSDQYLLFESLLNNQRINKDQLMKISTATSQFSTGVQFLQRTYLDESTWIWEIHGDKSYKEMAEKIIKSSENVSGVPSDSIYQQCMSFYRGFEMDQKEVERNVNTFKQSMEVDDKIILRAKIAVIEEIGNKDEQKKRLEQFLSIKKLEPFACELLALTAHRAEQLDIRNKFLKMIQNPRKRLGLVLQMQDEPYALELIKGEREKDAILALCSQFLLFGIKNENIRITISKILQENKA